MILGHVWRRIALIIFVPLLATTGMMHARAQSADELAAASAEGKPSLFGRFSRSWEWYRLGAQVSRLSSQSKYGEAIPLAERYVALARQKHGEDHAEYATAISWLASVYEAQGRYAEAEPLYKHSLAVREKALGAEHPSVATVLNTLAELYARQGRYAEAEPLFNRSLAAWEKALGAEHPSVATVLNNLAALYVRQGRYAEAEPLYRRSLAIREKALGAEHPRSPPPSTTSPCSITGRAAT